MTPLCYFFRSGVTINVISCVYDEWRIRRVRDLHDLEEVNLAVRKAADKCITRSPR